eukprot:TRINITY_DN10948_c0_g1_i1.p1 TRINITY_DN10948_c0_g1~~TRINITY_DN10948_c0_g1_i1.p1  ORF type:complete len:289 (+),score=110.85 TRINITY_DN10948_c0_g1_i1:76-867(+)
MEPEQAAGEDQPAPRDPAVDQRSWEERLQDYLRPRRERVAELQRQRAECLNCIHEGRAARLAAVLDAAGSRVPTVSSEGGPPEQGAEPAPQQQQEEPSTQQSRRGSAQTATAIAELRRDSIRGRRSDAGTLATAEEHAEARQAAALRGILSRLDDDIAEDRYQHDLLQRLERSARAERDKEREERHMVARLERERQQLREGERAAVKLAERLQRERAEAARLQDEAIANAIANVQAERERRWRGRRGELRELQDAEDDLGMAP